ncbi:hypothetical protein FKP32DRAFT_1318026 [Trametes sanguinea]|nr:hypothetical protein FKP32DRAFT_1318026 [Trametes sanguinea]
MEDQDASSVCLPETDHLRYVWRPAVVHIHKPMNTYRPRLRHPFSAFPPLQRQKSGRICRSRSKISCGSLPAHPKASVSRSPGESWPGATASSPLPATRGLSTLSLRTRLQTAPASLCSPSTSPPRRRR